MKHILLILLLATFPSIILGQVKKDTIKAQKEDKELKLSLDTLKLQTILPPEKPKSWDWWSIAPPVAAIIVCIITVIVNIYVARMNIKNNQENELRNSISEFLSQCAMINVLASGLPINDKLYIHFEKMFYHRSKIDLLLNSQNNEMKELTNALNNIQNISVKVKSDKEAKEFKEAYLSVIDKSKTLLDHLSRRIYI